MKFKDENNKVHDPEMGETDGLAFLKKVRPDVIFTPITDEEAATLTAPTPLTAQEISDNKDAQVEAELGGANIRVLVGIFKQIVTDGTISTKTPDEIISQAKTKRRNEL